MTILIETPYHAFEATCARDADLDGTFPCIDEFGDKLEVNGWQCDIEILD